MDNTPVWLPPIINVNGEWSNILRILYNVFTRDFIHGKPKLENVPVWWDNRKIDDIYEEGFWHLITKFDYTINQRLPDPRRAERLPWCAPIIDFSNDSVLKVWDYLESNNRVRTYIWLVDGDYVVILEKKKKRVGLIAFLVTAFHVDGPSSKRNLKRKFEKKVT